MLPFFSELLFKLFFKNRFYCERLTSNLHNKELVNDFYIEREKDIYNSPNTIRGLKQYLQKKAWSDDIHNLNTIYLIKDRKTKMIAAYFGLKAGMVSLEDSDENTDEEIKRINDIRKSTLLDGCKSVNQSIPGIELSHFAINDTFRKELEKESKKHISGLGYLFFPKFIYPIIKNVHSKIGVKFFYLYAADSSKENKLVNYYKKVMGLTTLKKSDNKVNNNTFSIKPIRANYDNRCIFMYKTIDDEED